MKRHIMYFFCTMSVFLLLVVVPTIFLKLHIKIMYILFIFLALLYVCILKPLFKEYKNKRAL